MTPNADAVSTVQLPALPQCWSALSWQQLCRCWEAKLRYGGNPYAVRTCAFLAIAGLSVLDGENITPTGERLYTLRDDGGRLWTTTARQLSHLANSSLQWLDYPYGDRGDEPVRDEKGKVVKERREPVPGYVNPDWRDAMQLPQETLTLTLGSASETDESVTFALPQLACNNLTWEQYRSLQPLVPQLFQQGITEEQALSLQAQFTAYCMVPEEVHEEPSKDLFRPAHTFKFNSERAEQSVAFWQEQIKNGSVIFHICFQVYQTAIQYYEQVYPLLFGGGGKDDPLRDALTGETGAINAVMKYARYRNQREVYESYLPYIFDILNTMTKEAKEIEKMNAKIKKKK